MNLTSVSYSGELDERATLRRQIFALEAAILEQEQRDCPVVHHYAPGVYVREMRVPPWTVLTEDGLQVLEAPCTILSKPGIKRVGRTFEEGATWSTIHANPDDCRDMDVIVGRLCTTPNSELLGNRVAALTNTNEVPLCL